MTEYEHERQANIAGNQEILKSLNIPILHKSHVSKGSSNMPSPVNEFPDDLENTEDNEDLYQVDEEVSPFDGEENLGKESEVGDEGLNDKENDKSIRELLGFDSKNQYNIFRAISFLQFSLTLGWGSVYCNRNEIES